MIDEQEIRASLRDHPVPDAAPAGDRSWRLVRAAYREEQALDRRGWPRRRLAAIAASLAAVAATLGLVLTPAGATVSDWVRDAVGGSETPTRERPALTHVPSGGRLLVGTGSGQWVISEDGSRRYLGDFRDAAWSPGGLFVAAAAGEDLVAVSPDGERQWTVAAPGPVEDPIWAPGCCRVAYRSGGDLRVVDGTGNFDHRIASAAAVAPSWRPAAYDLDMQESRNVVAFVDGRGRLQAVDADSGRRLLTAAVGGGAISVHWLSRDRILVATGSRIEIFTVGGGNGQVIFKPRGETIAGVDAAPGAPAAAVLLARASARAGKLASRLILVDVEHAGTPPKTLFSGLGRYQGPLLSPDGSRVQLGWRGAGQWIFAATERGADPVAVDNISRQFDAGGGGSGAPLPRIESWCCR